MNRVLVIAILLALYLILCGNSRICAQSLSEPEKNFEFLWNAYDANYAIFKAKHIDWQALYNIYRPKVSSKTSDDELFDIISDLLGHLNDNHVRLVSKNPDREFRSGLLYEMFGKKNLSEFKNAFRTRPVPETYFKAPLTETGNNIFAYGWIDDNIGYFHFNSFDNMEVTEKAIDEIIAKFKDAKAIIADVRRNGGGDDRLGQLIASRFADKKRLYMTTRDRDGKKHDDFDPPKRFFVEPRGPLQFTKTVILLTNRLSISAAENFTLAMRILPHVTVVGDFTSGCFADLYPMQLPNGWRFSLSQNLFLDYNGFCWEGIGVPPDIKVSCDYNNWSDKNDRILETAVSLIKYGKLGLLDEQEGLASTVSLVELLKRETGKEGIDKAIEKFNGRYGSGDKNFYVDFFELLSLGNNMLQAGQEEKGKKIFELASWLFPGVSAVNETQGFGYLSLGKKKEAIRHFREAISQKLTNTSPYSRKFSDYLGDDLMVRLLSDGYQGMVKEYEILKEKYPLFVNENLLNTLGYSLLGSKLTSEAILVFRLNVEKYPESGNTYDSLAEAYMNAGNKELAIENYERSLKLNPGNTNAVEQLKKIRGK